MKKLLLLFITSLLVNLSLLAQGGWLKPNNSHGTIMNGVSNDSATAFPVGCGNPSTNSSINLYTRPIKKPNLYFDSCNHRFWIYDPKLNAWDTIKAGGGSFYNSQNGITKNVDTFELGGYITKPTVLSGDGVSSFQVDALDIQLQGIAGQKMLLVGGTASLIGPGSTPAKVVASNDSLSLVLPKGILNVDSISRATNTLNKGVLMYDTISKRFLVIRKDSIGSGAGVVTTTFSKSQITYYDSLTSIKIIDGDVVGYQPAFITSVRMKNDSLLHGIWRGYNHSNRGLPAIFKSSPDGTVTKPVVYLETDSIRNYTNFAVSNFRDTIVGFTSDGINGHCFKRYSVNNAITWVKDSINLAMGINIYVVGSGTYFKGNNIVPMYTITLPAGGLVRSGVMWNNNIANNTWDTAWFPNDVSLQLSEGSTPIIEGDSLVIFVRSETNAGTLYRYKSINGKVWVYSAAPTPTEFLHSKPEVAKTPDGRYLLNARSSVAPYMGVVWISSDKGSTWTKIYEQQLVYFAYGSWIYLGGDNWLNNHAAQRSNGFGDIYKDVYSIARPSIIQDTLNIEKQGAPFSVIREMTNREVYNAYSPGVGLYSQRYGHTALAGDGQFNTALGHNAIIPNGFSQTTVIGSTNTGIGNLNTMVGAQINGGGYAYATLIGSSITSYDNYNTYVGRSISGVRNAAVGYGITNGTVMMGYNLNASTFNSIYTFGSNLTATADRQMMFGNGSSGLWPVDIHFGPPGGSANANDYGILSLKGINGLGTNIAGQGVAIKSGISTGSGSDGPVTFWTSNIGSSGASSNTLIQRMSISSGGVNVNIDSFRTVRSNNIRPITDSAGWFVKIRNKVTGAEADSYWPASGSSSITLGTTPITGGTPGRLLVESAGNKVTESANVFYDSTNAEFEVSKLVVGTTSTGGYQAKIQASGANALSLVSTSSSVSNPGFTWQDGSVQFVMGKVGTTEVGMGMYTAHNFRIITNQATRLTIDGSSDKVGIGVTSPESVLHLKAGTASANTAPVQLNTGTSETTPRAGLLQYTTPQLTFTNGGLIEQELAQIQQARVGTQYDNTTTTLGTVTDLTKNVAAGKTYRFEVKLFTTSNVAGGVKVAMAGTATTTLLRYETLITDAGLITQGRSATTGVTAVTAAYITINGIVTVNAAGSFLVQFSANAATGTSSVLTGSTFVLTEML